MSSRQTLRAQLLPASLAFLGYTLFQLDWGNRRMHVHRFVIASAILTWAMIWGPGRVMASADLGAGAIDLPRSHVVLAQWGPYKYGGYVAPYRYGRPFLYTYPPPAYRPYRFYRYPRFYYSPPLYYFRSW